MSCTRIDRPIRVLDFFATNDLSGPGKGIIQLIENTDPEIVTHVVCNFRHPKQKTFEFLEVTREKGIEIELITQRFALDFNMVSQATEIAKRGNFDVVVSHNYKTNLLAWRVSRRLQLPWIAISHGWTAENFKIRIYNWFERLLLRLPNLAIGVSPSLGAELCEIRGRKPSLVILNAIEKTQVGRNESKLSLRHELGIDEDRFVLVVVGRLSFEKGQDQLLESIRGLSILQNILLLVVGDGVMRGSLEDRVQRYGLNRNVRFVGYTNDVERYFAASDLCVLPSRSEGLPNVILEAQQMMCPVLAFDVGGVGVTIEDGRTGFLVPDGSTDEMAKAIDWLYQHPAERAQIARNAKKALFPKFSVTTRCQEFIDAYRNVIGSFPKEGR